MTTDDFDAYDDEGNRRRAQQEWAAEQTQARLERFLGLRPPVFATEGELHPAIVRWVNRIASPAQPATGSLLLFGGVGVGKTWSLWKLGERLYASGWRGRYEVITAYELKNAIMPPVDNPTFDRWAGAEVLAVDDLGAQRITDWNVEKLHELVDRRWQHQRSTVITSNEYNLKAVLGDRIASRLAAQATVVTFDDENDRRRAS